MNECSNKPERLLKPVPDSRMSEYVAMIDDQHPTGTMTA
ncbi:TPA: hypothetical protein MAR18_000912 [Klebsiella pneumoniae]|nr:hypothetical protein [Klebsiella pneumoniae]